MLGELVVGHLFLLAGVHALDGAGALFNLVLPQDNRRVGAGTVCLSKLRLGTPAQAFLLGALLPIQVVYIVKAGDGRLPVEVVLEVSETKACC